MTRTKKLFAALLAVLMIMAVLPVAALASEVSYQSNEAKQLAKLDKAWASIEAVEEEMKAMKATPAEVAAAAYQAALNNPLVDKGSLVWEKAEQFAFTVDGMHCLYYYRARNTVPPQNVTSELLDIIEAPAKGSNCGAAGTANVLLVGPYYSSDSSFTDQYKTESTSIANATGGTCTQLVNANATGPNIASNYTNKGVVIYDSHGVQSGTSSYLCLTTNSGITTTDYNNGWAVSSGSAAYIDGRYIQNHVSGTLSNCFVWMAICEGMKKAGKGTTGTALLAAGAGGVYGYSQSVSFTGDYKYEATFWTEMKNGATVQSAIATMKSTWGNWDPAYSSSSGAAWPIVMSAVDAFPSNPDGTQTVNCDWELFGSIEPDPITSVSVANVNVVVGGTANVNITVNPSNADYTVQSYTSSNTSVATVNSNGVVTGVAAGTSTLTVKVKDNTNNTVYTKTATITVEEFEGYMLVDSVENGGKYIIVATSSISGTTGYAVGNTVVTSGHYLTPVAVTINSDDTCTVSSTNEPKVVWVASGNDTNGYSFYNEAVSKYMSLDSSEYLYVGDTALAWKYNSNQRLDNQIDSEGYYYLSYTTSSTTRYTTSKDSSTSDLTIKLYKLITSSTPEPTYYTVTFKDWDGTTLSTQQVAQGSAATAPANPTRTGYTFTGWDVDFSNVQSNLTVNAQYTINSYTLTINYVYAGGGTASPTYTQSYNYGAAYSVTSPTIAGYTPNTEVVSGTMGAQNVTVTVTYTMNAPVGLAGDANGDGVVNMLDVTDLNAYLMNCGTLDPNNVALCDMNGDGVINAYDSTLIAMIALGISF